ncbi:MAG TPA: site-specific integrase [Rhodothermales bacterium]|nr:site-specific integrase [Rhodothermales bacterium]
MLRRVRQQGESTKYPGVFRVGDGVYRLHAKATDPRTGRPRQAERLYRGTLTEAARERAALFRSLRAPETADRQRVIDYATSWIASKAGTVDSFTLRRYADILDQHVLPTFGEFYLDAIRPTHIQEWVNQSKREKVSANTVQGWYRVLRMLFRDAVQQLDLGRDPCVRILLPNPDEPSSPNAIGGGELRLFLGAMRKRFPEDHALVATLAFTGLRTCHVTGLKWEDVDEENGVIHIRRRHYLGTIGPVSAKKRAPKVTPLVPELAAILRQHRARLIRRQAKGLDEGWVFPSRAGKPRRSTSLTHAWRTCCEAAGITERFTPHGLRRTFHDLAREAQADAVVVKALVGHVTDTQHEHYSNVRLDEKRAAVASVVRLATRRRSADRGMDAKPSSDGSPSEKRRMKKDYSI